MGGNLSDASNQGAARNWTRRLAVPLGLAVSLGFLTSLSWFLVAAAPAIPAADRADVLFGASSLALMIFSLVVAFLALVGWKKVEELIADGVQKQLDERLSTLEREMRGRVQSGLGHLIGELSCKPGKFPPADRERLGRAVDLCEAGYKQLKGLGGGAELLGLNNLVYYLAVEGRADRQEFVLEKARMLCQEGQERGVPWMLLTYCRAVLAFERDERELARAERLTRELVKNKQLETYELKEAKLYLRELEKRRAPKLPSQPPVVEP
jgi:hypothetical protein